MTPYAKQQVGYQWVAELTGFADTYALYLLWSVGLRGEVRERRMR